MILIGISGESGSGKTLTSDIMAERLKCEVYHLDDLQKEVEVWKKKSFLKRFTIPSKGNNGENKVIINPKLKGKNMSTKTVENLYQQIKMAALKSIIMKKIIKQKSSKAKYFIIEGTQLAVYAPIDLLDVKILMNRQYELRERDVILRDGISEEDFKTREEYDKPKINLCKNFEYKIENNGTREQLEEQINTILNKTREKDDEMTL